MRVNKKIVVLAVLVCVLYACRTTGQAADKVPTDKVSVKVLEPKIVGPDTVQLGGRPIKLDVQGVTAQQILDGGGKVILYPRDGAEIWEASSWTGQPYLLFFADKKGKYLVLLVFSSDNKLACAEKEVTCGTPDPDPDPDPNPDPDPDPDPTPGKKFVMVIAESHGRGSKYASTLMALKTYTNEKEHEYQLVDPDGVDEDGDSPAWFNAYKQLVTDAKITGPAILIGDVTDKFTVKNIVAKALPDTPATVIELVKSRGG